MRAVAIGEVVTKPETANPRERPDNPFTYIDISSVDNRSKRIMSTSCVIGRDAPSRARQLVHRGDVVVATTRPNLNAVAVVPEELDGAICSTGFAVLRPTAAVDTHYLFLFVQSPVFVESLSALVQGALYPAVRERDVLSRVIPLPLLDEQRKIAGQVGRELAAASRAGRTALDCLKVVPDLVDSVREAVLASSGSSPRLPLGRIVPGRGAIIDGPFGSSLKTEHYEAAGARVIRLQNIGAGEFLAGDEAFVSLERFRMLRSHEAVEGDVVVAALGDGARPAGRACRIPAGLGPAIVKADCFRIRTVKTAVDADYLVQLLNSPSIRRQIAQLIRGATRPRFNLSMLRSLRLPWPELTTQRRMVANLQARLAHAQQLRDSLLVQEEALGCLSRAILREAFGRAVA